MLFAQHILFRKPITGSQQATYPDSCTVCTDSEHTTHRFTNVTFKNCYKQYKANIYKPI